MDNLKYGSRGTDVELLQLALTRSGYYNSPYGIDGILGADTQNAVRRFQAAFGLAADGIVGRDTKKALLPFLIGAGVGAVATLAGQSVWRYIGNRIKGE